MNKNIILEKKWYKNKNKISDEFIECEMIQIIVVY